MAHPKKSKQGKSLASYGITPLQLHQAFKQWESGAMTKCAIEESYLNNTTAHGKLITSLFRKFLKKETEGQSPLAHENANLKQEIQRLQAENVALKNKLNQRKKSA